MKIDMGPGQRYYLGAMARGGGRNDYQAKELLKLDLVKFLWSVSFAARVMGDPVHLDQLAKFTNTVHSRLPRANLNRVRADLDAHDIRIDMGHTLEYCLAQARGIRKLIIMILYLKFKKQNFNGIF